MLRLLQTSDLHLGARNVDLGEAAATLRDRRFAAFERALALAVSEKVNLVLVVGDLFDTNEVTRGLVGRVAAGLAGLATAGIRTVILPGDHDRAGSASVYRAFDLGALAGAPGSVTILDPSAGPAGDLSIPELGITLTARFPAPELHDDRWRIGLVHRQARPRDDEIAGAGVDYLAVGGPHEEASGVAADVAWGASGAPDPVDPARDRGGEVILVRLDERGDRRSVSVERHRVGSTRYEALALDLGGFKDDAALEAAIAARADGGAGADLILDVHLERRLVRRARGRSRGARGPPPAALPRPPGPERRKPGPEQRRDPVGRDRRRGVHPRSRGADRHPVDGDPPADELREALRLGRRLLIARSDG